MGFCGLGIDAANGHIVKLNSEDVGFFNCKE